MHVIKKGTLTSFGREHPKAYKPLMAWYAEASAAKWKSSAEIKRKYREASILNSERVVFDIGGNKYRIVARINYRSETIFIHFVGTHAEYDKINVETI